MYTLVRRIRRWGNSYGIRLQKEDLTRLGLREGAEVDLEMRPHKQGRVDLSDLPTFSDPDPLMSIHHDKILYGPSRKARNRGR